MWCGKAVSFSCLEVFYIGNAMSIKPALHWLGHDLLHIHLSKLRAGQTVSLISMLSCYFLLQQHVQMAKLPGGQAVSFPCLFVQFDEDVIFIK
jgi:hypothetical protein